MKRMRIEKMVNDINEVFPLDEKVKRAFYRIDRELFVKGEFRHLSFYLDALPMQGNQWISSPLTVAKMTQYFTVKRCW